MKRLLGVDVGAEVNELRVGLEGARTLVDLLWQHRAGDDEEAEELPRRISATITAVVLRMRHLERCLNGSRDPAELDAKHSRSLGPEGTHLRPWSDDRRLADLERERRRLQRQQAGGQRRRRS